MERPNILVDRRLLFFCTGFKVISMGIVTNFSTSSALLPGHCVIIVISVLVTSGNASIDISLKVIIPVIMRIVVANKMKYLFFKENAIILLSILFIDMF